MSEDPSEKTPNSGGVRAIEDVGPQDGVMMRPSGPPRVLGPELVNPFWSESVREEALLRAIRPTDLPPQESPELMPAGTPNVSPPRESDAVRAVIQGLMAENAKLWMEKDAMTPHQMDSHMGYMPSWVPQQQMGMGSGFQGHQQEKNMLAAMFDAMRMSMGNTEFSKGKGLLGPLSGNGDRGGLPGLVCPPGDYGGFERHWSGPKASLMEVFNRVSSSATGSMVQSLFPGLADSSKSISWGSNGPSMDMHSSRGYETGVFVGGTASGVPGSGHCQHAGVSSHNRGLRLEWEIPDELVGSQRVIRQRVLVQVVSKQVFPVVHNPPMLLVEVVIKGLLAIKEGNLLVVPEYQVVEAFRVLLDKALLPGAPGGGHPGVPGGGFPGAGFPGGGFLVVEVRVLQAVEEVFLEHRVEEDLLEGVIRAILSVAFRHAWWADGSTRIRTSS